MARAMPSRAESGVIVGVDIGGTKTALVAVDRATGDEIGREKFATPHDKGPDHMLGALERSIDALLREAGRERAELRAVGVAVPGQVDTEGKVLGAGNLAGWDGLPLGERLTDLFGVPVFVDHDANCGALGEQWRGCGRGVQDFVFLALGTGLGAGVVIGGKIHRGAHHAAGEVGSMVPGRHQLGHPGPGQHLGELAGGRRIRNKARQAVGKKLSAAEAIRGAADDERLEPLAEDVADYVGLVVLGLAAVLDPELIILGGGTASAGDELIERVRERVQPKVVAPLKLVRAGLGEDAQAFGAVCGALRRLEAVAAAAG